MQMPGEVRGGLQGKPGAALKIRPRWDGRVTQAARVGQGQGDSSGSKEHPPAPRNPYRAPPPPAAPTGPPPPTQPSPPGPDGTVVSSAAWGGVHVRTRMSLCAHARAPVRPAQAPHLLVVDIGKDAGHDLQQEDDEEQDEVLGQGRRQ